MTTEATTDPVPTNESAIRPMRTRQVQVPHPKAAEIRYGVELELLLPRGTVRVGPRHAGVELGGAFPPGWNAQHDGSLSTTLPNYEGVEIVSPILKGVDGLVQITKVCELIQRLGGRVNATTGFHVHCSATDAAGQDYNKVAEWVRRLILLTAHHELALYGASGTKRRFNGRYCASLRQGRWAQKKEQLKKRDMTADELRLSASGIDRYQLLNIQNLFGTKQTVEWRCFSGTVEPIKARAWVMLCLALATRALDHTADFEGAMGWTVDRFFDRDAANGVARLLRELSARRVCGQSDDVVVQRLDACERITPQEYAARAASGAKFEVVE